MRSYDEESFFHYPWRVHVFMLLPLTAATLFTALAFGWWGEPVRVAFAVLRTEYPSVTLALHLVTDFGNPLLYCGYVVLLAQAAHARDMGRLRDIACFAAISLLALCVILQIVKYGLGIPRPAERMPDIVAGAENLLQFVLRALRRVKVCFHALPLYSQQAY